MLKKIPSFEEWEYFLSNIQSEKGTDFSNLWYSKAKETGGVPLRKDFSFEELVKYGTNIFMAKLDASGKWLTTFCGNDIVENTGFDSTGKVLNEFGHSETLDVWLDTLTVLVNEYKPVIEFHTLEFINKDHVHCMAINFPLRSEGSDTPDIFISYEVFTHDSLKPDNLT